jgi:hypothetical protein
VICHRMRIFRGGSPKRTVVRNRCCFGLFQIGVKHISTCIYNRKRPVFRHFTVLEERSVLFEWGQTLRKPKYW